jgi:folate-binding Fe-S cluster repair protein YgfZ
VPTLIAMSSATSHAVLERPRAFIRVSGPDAEDYLQRMVSNDVAALAPGDACDALMLTAKARIIAPLRILRRGSDDFLVLTEPGLGEVVRSQLLRARFAAKAEIEPEEHRSWLVLGGDEVLDERPPGDDASEEEWSRRHAHQFLEGLLPRAGADRAAALPRQGQPPPACLGHRGGRC